MVSIRLLLLVLLVEAVCAAAKKSQHVAFITIAGHSAAGMMADAARQLRNQDPTVRATIFGYSAHRQLFDGFLNETEYKVFSHAENILTGAQSIEAMEQMGESNLKGVPKMLQFIAGVYPNQVEELRTFFEADKPDFLVIDMFATSAIDLATHMKIDFAVFYHCPILGLFGVEDTLSAPDMFVEGPDLATSQTFAARLRKAFTFPQIIMATKEPTDLLNAKRAALGFPTYMEPTTNWKGHPLLVTSVFGFEYPRPLSPLTRLVGMYVNKDPLALKPSNGHEKHILQWLAANDRPVVLVTFGTEAVPHLHQIQSIIEGVRASGHRLLMAVRHQVLAHRGVEYVDLIQDRHDDVNILPWVPTQVALHHKTVQTFLCHGGAQSIAEAIYAAVPLIMLPMNADRSANSARVTDAKIGLRLDQHTFTAADVTAAIAELQVDKTRRRMVRRMKWLQSVNDRAGAGAAGTAEAVLDYLATGYGHLVPYTDSLSPLAVNGLDVYLLLTGSFLGGVFLLLKLLCTCFCRRKKSAHKMNKFE